MQKPYKIFEKSSEMLSLQFDCVRLTIRFPYCPTCTRCKYMKNYSELTQKFYDFIKNHKSDDVLQLYMKMSGKESDFPVRFAICQIECRQKTAKKLSRWLRSKNFTFPCTEVAEQSTHQCVAAYHASLVGSGKNILDITAGLGIDAFTLADAGNNVTAIELDNERADAIGYNAKILQLPVKVINDDSINFLYAAGNDVCYDVIFADPARRDAEKKRVYSLTDSIPDIVGNFPLLNAHADTIIIKASPLIDLSDTLRQLPYITSIHIVCVKGECKETLLVCASDQSFSGKRYDADKRIEVTVADLEETIEGTLEFRSVMKMFHDDTGNPESWVEMADIYPGVFLYDPNAGLHKINCGAILCKRFERLKKLSPNTDLFMSDTFHPDFPGRIFKIDIILDKKSCKQLKGANAEVAVRNYPIKAENLRKKLGVSSGGSNFVFGCRIGARQTPVLLLCDRF